MRAGELQPRHIKAAHLPDAATYLIAGSLQADRALSVWLIPFSSQYPVDALVKPFGERSRVSMVGAPFPRSTFEMCSWLVPT